MRLFKRGKKWYIDCSFNGKRYRHPLATDKEVAKDAARKFITELERDNWNITREASLTTIFERFITYCRAGNVTKSTAEYYGYTIKTFTDFLKSNGYKVDLLKASNIDVQLIERFKDYRLNVQKRQPKTVNNDITNLQRILNVAVQLKLAKSNPFAGIKRLRTEHKKPLKFLTQDQLQTLISVAREKDKIIIKFVVYTGLRYGELRHLQWSDIDLRQRVIKVQNKENWHTKSYQSRMIPLHPDIERLLMYLKSSQDVTENDYVFPGESRSSFHHRLVKLSIKAGLPRVTPHILRHTFASYLAMSGVDQLTIQKLLGHSDPRTTQIYMHLAEDHIRAAVTRLKIGFDLPVNSPHVQNVKMSVLPASLVAD